MSMFGGVPIYINSLNGGFDEMPAQNTIWLESREIVDAKFSTSPVNGKITEGLTFIRR